MIRAQFLACKAQLEQIAILVREAPLEQFIADATTPADAATKAIAEALLPLQRSLPPVAPNIYRGTR